MQIQVVVILLFSEGNHRTQVLYCFHVYITKRPKELLQSVVSFCGVYHIYCPLLFVLCVLLLLLLTIWLLSPHVNK